MAQAAVKKMMPPGTTIWWVPIADAPTVKDVVKATLYSSTPAKAKDISCAVVSGFTLNPTDSETDDTTTICDSAASNTPTRDAYEASLTFLREALDEASGKGNPDSPASVAFELFKKGGVSANVTGWLVKRIGYKNTTPAKAGQLVSAFLVMPDNPRDEVGEGKQPIQMTVPFLPQGTMVINEPFV
nr:MAG TPA: major tail protein [Caudoviricetes sp.]